MGGEYEVTDIKIKVNLKRSNLSDRGRTGRRSIYLNGDYAFSLSEGIFVESQIALGDRLTDGDVRRLVGLDTRQEIKEAALTLLSYRPRSVQEMRRRLRDKGWSKQEIEPVIEELEKRDFLNDGEFALIFARDRVQRKFLGPAGLKSELRRMGIDPDLVDEVIEKTYRSFPPQGLIRSLLKARRVDLSGPVEVKEKSRIINLLKRKGFSWDDMESVISRLKTH